MEHGLTGLDEGGKVKDTVEGPSLGSCGSEKLFNGRPILQLSLNELYPWGQQVAPSMAQVVKNYGVMPIFGQQTRNSTTYVPRPASYQDFHEKTRPF
jgi:hypothetical protein